jgi:histidinol dehydrogenase
VGDYFAGPNHTIPTGGRARFSSPLSVQDFVKKSSVLRYSAARLAKESAAIRMFAEREQLFAHAEAVRVRGPELRDSVAAAPQPTPAPQTAAPAAGAPAQERRPAAPPAPRSRTARS